MTKYTLKFEEKKPTNYIVNFRRISEVSDIYTTKYTPSLIKNRLQDKSKISDYIGSFQYTSTYKIHSKLEQKTLTK